MPDINIINSDNYILHSNDIDMAIYDACQELEIDDLKNEGQRPWKAVLALAGKRLFPDTKVLKQESNIYNNSNMHIESNCNSYDYNKLMNICDYYVDILSGKYNKLVSTVAFSNLCNIPTTTIDLWKDSEPGSTRFKIWKKLQVNREDCLKDKNYDSNNVVGAISIGNTEFGWSLPGVSREQVGKREQMQISDTKTAFEKFQIAQNSDTITAVNDA